MSNHNITIERLREENKRLQVLLHLAQNLQQHLDLESLLFVTMEEVAKILYADRCTVFLLDEEKDELWSIVALGIEKGKEIRFPADKGLAGHVARTGEILNIPDAYADSRFNPEIDKKTGYRTRNILSMPLINKQEEIIGVFQVLNKQDGLFSRADEELLMAISQIAATTIENSQLYEEQVESLNSFVETLSATLDTRDYITAGHSKRVTLYTLALCEQMAMEKECCEELRYAGLLHDIGKLGIPEVVLFKAGKLTDEEYELIKKHPAVTRDILGSIHFPRKLSQVSEIASTHHEKINGKGYPDGLKEDEIPLGGKMLALADVFDALTSHRQYREREPLEKVWGIIEEETGQTFEPKVVEVFKKISIGKILEILEYDQRERLSRQDLSPMNDVSVGKIVELKNTGTDKLSENDMSLLNVFDTFYWRKY